MVRSIRTSQPLRDPTSVGDGCTIAPVCHTDLNNNAHIAACTHVMQACKLNNRTAACTKAAVFKLNNHTLTHTYIHFHIHIHAHAHKHAPHIHTRAFSQTRACACTQTCTHTHTPHIQTHKHTNKRLGECRKKWDGGWWAVEWGGRGDGWRAKE
jgi:hypothetical protein